MILVGHVQDTLYAHAHLAGRAFSFRPRAFFHPLPTKAISSSLGAVLKFNDSRKSRKFRESCFFINVCVRGNNVKV